MAALALVLVVTGCDDATLTPSPGASGAAVPPTQAPSSSGPPPSVDPGTPSATPSTDPQSGVWPDFAARADLAGAAWNPGETFLRSGFRLDIQDYDGAGCRPRRDDLPDGATDGIECTIDRRYDDGPADRVGAYLFPDDAIALAAYEARLIENGLDPGTDGGCPFAAPGVQVGATPAPRSTCFTNDAGVANLRVFWPGASVVIGVLGRGANMERLGAWARGAAGGVTEGMIDVWVGSLGTPGKFAACPDLDRPDRVVAPTALAYEDVTGIVLTDPAGRHSQVLVKSGHGAQWSPDGRRLAFLAGDASARVRILDIASGEKRTLATFAQSNQVFRGTTLTWSPDGNWIGVTVMTDAAGDPEVETVPVLSSVWVLDPSTGDTHRVGDGALIAWSPDSSRILVRQSDEEGGDAQTPFGILRLVEVATGTGPILGRGDGGGWSPDCRFATLERGFDQRIGVTVVDGPGRRPQLAVDTTGVDWAPVAPELAIGLDRGGIWRVSFVDGGARRIGDGRAPIWSEDGRRLAVARRGGEFVIRADGSGARRVAPAEFPLGDLAWSPDGRFLAYSEEFTADTCAPPSYGFVIAANGSGVRELPSPYHAIWRPIDPDGIPGKIDPDPPPKGSEGCGG